MKTQLISHDQLVEMKGVTKNQIEVFKQYAKERIFFYMGLRAQERLSLFCTMQSRKFLTPKQIITVFT